MRNLQAVHRAGRRLAALRRAFAVAVPETWLLLRAADGSARQVAIGRAPAVALGAVGIGCVLWALVATLLLVRQPEELARRQQRLDDTLAAAQLAQQRLAASQKMVADITREVDLVQASLVGLAESNAALIKGTAPERRHPVESGVLPLRGDATADEGEEEAGPVRDQVRRLETSLERLRLAYAQAVQSTGDAAAARVADAERTLTRLGIDTGRVIGRAPAGPAQGGPFIPVAATVLAGEPALSGLRERLDRWRGVKAALLTLPLGEPLDGAYDVSSAFGRRNDPLNRRTGIHEGVDLVAPYGSPVHATGEGQVLFAGPWEGYGLAVEIDHGNGITTRYGHLSRILAHEGQHVTRTTEIGLLGSTGRSTGPHLHYEVRLSDVPRDPLKFIAAGDDALKIW
ncbi:M23 family metallopeptidase [Phaeospirillum tilakii]|uniref:M23 family metallopeptidase n=1 Tax=Phaeospirillum tilakii TaxID=741673 RepID=A0ABW5CE18_9PROT